jgi:hypothetical protein
MGFDMIELETRPGIATPAIGRDERALTAVPTVDFSAHGDGQVASVFAELHGPEFALPGLS